MPQQSFPRIAVTGPVHHFIAPSAGNTIPAVGANIFYLGTAEVQPRVRWQPMMVPINNDVAGQSLPLQFKDDGEMASISCLLNRFSQRALSALGTPGAAGVNPGVQSRFSRGQLIFGNKSFQLWMVFENATNANVAALYPDLPLGYYFPQVKWDDLEDAPGNLDQKKLCSWQAHPYWIPQASYSAVNDAVNERGWFLYSCDPSYFTNVQVPQ